MDSLKTAKLKPKKAEKERKQLTRCHQIIQAISSHGNVNDLNLQDKNFT